ncbi:NB-ARC domain-containing protein [Streptomyces sp. NBC_01387]|uniref:ATP-binding protein n=1 Tax=unclassified Streptomyces TaxID=2593676 RepID=UPI002E35AC76|nr:NB-ARC domain-containing protein [Streptomyces sp. NBC_01267]
MAAYLPTETTSLVGRKNELDHLRSAFARYRLITLTGIGGVGKTRIALRAASRAAPDCPDGVWWADLSPLSGERLLLATVSDAVGLSDHTARSQVDALCEWLTDKQGLLVLDSCEHLVDACRSLVGDVLTSAPGLTVLVTSRQALGVGGEHTVAVEPLPVEGDQGALALFTDRAATAAPGLSLADPGTAKAAADICRRLEGIPLAVELAAAQLRARSAEQVAERLNSRFDALVEGGQEQAPRHRTLRTAIGWSHELCEPLERLMWARLSVFRGWFDEHSARAVCTGGPLSGKTVDRALEGLVEKSVLTWDGARYRMLDTIREYGRLWLEELGESAALSDLHAAHCLAVAREADAGWLSSEQSSWYQRIADVHTDLCTAMDRLLVTDTERALELIGLVGFFWSCCGHLHEVRSYLERALALHPRPGPYRGRALWALGVATLLQGEHDLAHELGVQCDEAAQQQNDREMSFAAGYLLGLSHLMSGRPLAAHTVAVRLPGPGRDTDETSASRRKCRLVEVFALTGLGLLTEARQEAEALRTACLRTGDWWTRSYTDYQLSLISLFQDRPDDAADHARAMLTGKRRIGDAFGIALGLDLLAAALAAQGKGERAALVFGTSQAYWRTVGHPQRGTPELGPVREECERSARAVIGDDAYAEAFQRGASVRTASGLARALDGQLALP